MNNRLTDQLINLDATLKRLSKEGGKLPFVKYNRAKKEKKRKKLAEMIDKEHMEFLADKFARDCGLKK